MENRRFSFWWKYLYLCVEGGFKWPEAQTEADGRESTAFSFIGQYLLAPQFLHGIYMQHDGAPLHLLTIKVLPSETESDTSYFCKFLHVSVLASAQTLMLKRYSGTSLSRCLWLHTCIPLPGSQTGVLTISGSLISLSSAANCSVSRPALQWKPLPIQPRCCT